MKWLILLCNLENMAGDIKYRDVNKDGKITDLDQVPIGYPKEPEIVYGFGASYGYKNWDISVFFSKDWLENHFGLIIIMYLHF